MMKNLIVCLVALVLVAVPHVSAVSAKECDPKVDGNTCGIWYEWPSCVASSEVCDGVDNDCNGEIDEGKACAFIEQPQQLEQPQQPQLPEQPGTCGYLPQSLPNGQLDSDGDDVPDSIDNCPCTSNLDQTDSNSNGIGDACEEEIPEFSLVILGGTAVAGLLAVVSFRKR